MVRKEVESKCNILRRGVVLLAPNVEVSPWRQNIEKLKHKAPLLGWLMIIKVKLPPKYDSNSHALLDFVRTHFHYDPKSPTFSPIHTNQDALGGYFVKSRTARAECCELQNVKE